MENGSNGRIKNAALLGMIALVSMGWGIGYIIGQQILRQGANEPQIKMVKTAVADLESGKTADQIMSSEKVLMENSDQPFLILFNKNGEVTDSNVSLDGQTPQPPEGVLKYATKLGINKITWQPKPGVRNAIVVIPIKNQGWVLAGKSLRQTEIREDRWLEIALAGWLISLVIGGFLIRKAN